MDNKELDEILAAAEENLKKVCEALNYVDKVFMAEDPNDNKITVEIAEKSVPRVGFPVDVAAVRSALYAQKYFFAEVLKSLKR